MASIPFTKHAIKRKYESRHVLWADRRIHFQILLWLNKYVRMLVTEEYYTGECNKTIYLYNVAYSVELYFKCLQLTITVLRNRYYMPISLYFIYSYMFRFLKNSFQGEHNIMGGGETQNINFHTKMLIMSMLYGSKACCYNIQFILARFYI
jgi:hypothetical protein